MTRPQSDPSAVPDPNATYTRALVVADRETARELTVAGIAATTYGDVLAQPTDVVAGYFQGEPAAVVVDDGSVIAAAVADRLRSTIRTRVVRQDRRGRRR